MKPLVSRITLSLFAISTLLCITSRGNAQMRPMMIPLTTTMVITKAWIAMFTTLTPPPTAN